MKKFLLLYLFFFNSLFAVDSKDSLEEFFGKRFSLYPPSEDESTNAIVVIRNFFDYIIADQTEKAYFQTTTDDFRHHTSLKQFEQFEQKLKKVDLKKELDVHTLTFTNNQKTKATYIVVYQEKSSTFYIEFWLEKEESEWDISGIKLYETYKTGK